MTSPSSTDARTGTLTITRRSTESHPALMVVQRQLSADSVSGDLLWRYSDGRSLTMLMGDVCGRGDTAGVLAGEILAILPTLNASASPADLLTDLNAYVIERRSQGDGEEERFVAALLVVIEPNANRLAIYNAGHLPPLLIQGGEVEQLEAGGILLGVMSGVECSPAVRPFVPGDMLVLSTDGLPDAKSPNGCRVGEDGLISLVRQHRDLRPSDLIEVLLGNGYETGGDDMTVCVIQHRPPDLHPLAVEPVGDGEARGTRGARPSLASRERRRENR